MSRAVRCAALLLAALFVPQGRAPAQAAARGIPALD